MVPTLVAPAIDISVAQHLGRRNRILMTEVDIQGQAIGKGDAAGVDHARPIEDRLPESTVLPVIFDWASKT